MKRRSILLSVVAAVAVIVATAVPAEAALRPRAALPPNFVSSCTYSHSAPDDPIVKPGMPGASHLHDFFGNTTTDAGSTLESLLAGDTTCRRPLDTAGYWAPALYDDGQVIRPRAVLAYYQTAGKDPKTIKPFPAGLEVVADRAQWACNGDGKDSARSMTAPPDCRPDQELVVRIFFPDCWDGRTTESPDNRSHMAYNVAGRCPASHPVPVPRLRLGFRYPGASGGSDVTLASGDAGTAHADFFNAWDQAELERLVKSCLNAGVHCGARGPRR